MSSRRVETGLIIYGLDTQCRMPSLVWTKQEDEKLRELVERIGDSKWSEIARELGTKTGKQCRRRWKNALTMHAKTTTWSEEEDQKLIQYHKELGNKWTEISRRFGDRTDNAAKNRWSALCRKYPGLNDVEAPVTLVGVKRGTRTHSLIGASSSERASSKQRSDVISHSQDSGALPPATGNSLPTPFDQLSTGDLSSEGPAGMLRRQMDPLFSNSSTYHALLQGAGQMSSMQDNNGKSTLNASQSAFPKDLLEASDVMKQYLANWPMGAGASAAGTGAQSQQMSIGDFYNLLQSASQNMLAPDPGASSNSRRTMGRGNSLGLLDSFPLNSASSSLNSEQRQILETLLNQQSKNGIEISPPVQMPTGKTSEDLARLVSNFSQSEIESLISFLRANDQKS